jgi:apolipoprotein N-acyltransferase
MVEALPIFIPAVLKTQVEILEGDTFYVRFGDWFAWGITLVVVAIVLVQFSRRRATSPR